MHRLLGKIKITEQADQSCEDSSRIHAIKGIEQFAYRLGGRLGHDDDFSNLATPNQFGKRRIDAKCPGRDSEIWTTERFLPRPEDRIALLEEEVTELRTLLTEVLRKQAWPQYLTVEQLAEMLQISPRTVHDWVREKRLPYHKAGNQARFLIGEIVAWTAGQWDDKRRLRAVR